ncbi:unnamed protein product [Pleuronectes platessa]|uniref:ABM domain-containing protein n=1 Tax=Pleuronectes platessa TaxID=8262 RepID=A0A9N7ULB2_PLEPL|nr:unnamed protein product [Pleuronectes platessa]
MGAVEVRKEGLESQINRLAELIGRLENKTVWLDLHQRLTETDGTPSASLLLVRQEMVVSQKKLGEFCEALKQYLKNVSAQRDCFHRRAAQRLQELSVTAVRLPDGLSFVVYEFWDGEEEWKRHLQSAPNKAFQHVKVDTLCQPETVSSVAVPVSSSVSNLVLPCPPLSPCSRLVQHDQGLSMKICRHTPRLLPLRPALRPPKPSPPAFHPLSRPLLPPPSHSSTLFTYAAIDISRYDFTPVSIHHH